MTAPLMHTVATGLAFPEGPTALGDGTIACVEMQGGRIARVHPDGRVDPLAELGGGPNGSALGADGALYIANNGGLSMRVDGRGYWWADDAGEGRVQRVESGRVTAVPAAFPGAEPHRPNDLTTGPDGALYVTDSANWEDMQSLRAGTVVRLAGGDTTPLLELSGMPNGIAATDERLFVVESLTRRIWAYAWSGDGVGDGVEHVRLESGVPDGICLAADGTMFVCSSVGHSVVVVSPTGAIVDEFPTGDGSQPTNCCLHDGGLFVTLALTGSLVRFDVDVEAAPSFAGPWTGVSDA